MKNLDIWPFIKKDGNTVTIQSELVLMVLLTALIPVVIHVGALFPFRVFLGILFVLVFPGYALLAVLFPDKLHIDWLQRLGLSISASIAVIPPLAYVLNVTPWGVSFYPILISLSVFVLSLSMLAIYLRSNIAENERFFSKVIIAFPGANTAKWSAKARVSAAVGLFGLVVAGMTTYIITVPTGAESFTDFYVLSDAGLAQGYPRTLDVGQPVRFSVGIDNNERENNKYEISARIGKREVGRSAEISIDSGENRMVQVDTVPYEPAKGALLEFLLLKSGSEEPYRSLRLWVDVND